MDGYPITREVEPPRGTVTRRRVYERPTPNQIAQFREFRKVVPRIDAADLRQRLFHFSLPFPLYCSPVSTGTFYNGEFEFFFTFFDSIGDSRN